MTGDTALDEMIARLRSLPARVRDIAPAAAEACAKVVAGNIAAQRDPDGKPWLASKDGKPVLVDAMKNVSVSAVGSVVLFRVSGPEARHHLGAAKGGVVRRLIPLRAMPASIAAAIKSAVLKVLR